MIYSTDPRAVYMRKYYLTHKESVLSRNRRYRDSHREVVLDQMSLKKSDIRTRTRQKILDTLGRRCAQCGYDADYRALQIDHVRSNGAQERAEFTTKASSLRYYENILERIDTGDYQILCANCNIIKKYECGEFRRARGLTII